MKTLTNTDNPQDKYFYDIGWQEAVEMVLDVVGEMYNEYDQATLEELRQRIV